MGLGRRERVKNRVRDIGIKGLTTTEVLELMLYPFIPRKDTMPIARELLARFGGLEQVLDAHANALAEVPGVTPTAALLISSLKDIVSRATMERLEQDVYLTDYTAVGEYLCAYIGDRPRERFVALFLNINGRLLGKKEVSEGRSSETQVDFNAVTTTAINLGAMAVIVAHNHPSGNMTPSPNDWSCTEALGKTLEVLNVKLWDHIIVSRDKYVSLKKILADNNATERTHYLGENNLSYIADADTSSSDEN